MPEDGGSKRKRNRDDPLTQPNKPMKVLSNSKMDITIEVTPSPPFVGTITYRAIAWVGDQYTSHIYSQRESFCQEWCAKEAAKELSSFMSKQYPNATFKTKLTEKVETKFSSM
jgi:hypothetical protein